MGISSTSNPFRDLRPPNPPWVPIEHRDGSGATISYYYSDSNSGIPVRDVSHKKDPKADPNIETLTFGLFSTCCTQMRKSIATNGIKLHFFCTARKGRIRVLTGYYLTRWYYEVAKNDFMIAASSGRFIAPGFRLSELVPYLDGFRIDARFRLWRYLPEKVSGKLFFLLNDTPNEIDQYISEIHRLESLALDKYGCMYLGKSRGFSWDNVARPMKLLSRT